MQVSASRAGRAERNRVGMKHRLSFALTYACLLCLLTIGIWELGFAPREERLSVTENRMLQGMPVFSPSAALSGSYMEEFEAFLSDAFPGRDAAIAASMRVMDVFGEVSEEERSRTEQAELEAEGGEQVILLPVQEPVGAEESEAAAPAGPEQTAQPREESRGAGEARDASLWIVDNSGAVKVQEAYPRQNILRLAEVLNDYAQVLGPDGSVQFLNVPISYMGNMQVSHRASGWGCDLDEVLRGLVAGNVYVYDVTDIYGDAIYNEPLFSQAGDHHWYPRGAWRAVCAELETQGLVPTDYYEYLYRLESDFRGKPRTQAQLENIPLDTAARDIQVIEPLTPVESYMVQNVTELTPSVYMEEARFPHYGIYLGGRRGPYRLFVTGYHTGRNALIIGDSFYHAFLPYLTPYYDRILALDPRDEVIRRAPVGASIEGYIRAYDVKDVYFVTCTYTSVNGYVFQDRLAKLLRELPPTG